MKKNRWIAWKKWDDLCQPKVVGGLGFRGLKPSLSHSSKHGWRLLKNFESLLGRVLKAKFFSQSSFLRQR